MKTNLAIALIGVVLLSACKREVRIDGESLLALHNSTESMKRKLKLSKAGARALESAVDVLVGDATRALLEAYEAGGPPPGPERERAEARALAPIHELTLPEVLAAAAERRRGELRGLEDALEVERAAVAEQKEHLDLIKVVRAVYGMSLSSRHSWIDVTVHNATDQPLTELLLDCKLVEPASTSPREKGTCSLKFAGGIEPGASRVGQAYVGWETEPRSSRRVEAWPIKAYGANRKLLWEVPSALNPLEAGRIGDIRTRMTVVQASLRSLETSPPAL
jgi:hypothetical protein